MARYMLRLFTVAAVLLMCVPASPARESASPGVQDALDAMEREAIGAWRRVINERTGVARFVAAEPGGGIEVPPLPDAESRARAFLSVHSKAFSGAPMELATVRVSPVDDVGMEHVRLQQTHRGLPVTGAELVVHLKGDLVTAVNSTAIPLEPGLSIEPSITADHVLETVEGFLRVRLGREDATLSEPRLELFNRGVLEGVGEWPTRLAWFVEAHGPDYLEYIWVDAHTDGVLLHFDQMPRALNRQIYDAMYTSVLPGILVRPEGTAATGDVDVDAIYDYLGDSHNFVNNFFGRDSYDGQGAMLVASAHYCEDDQPCPAYPNASWHPGYESFQFGDGTGVADDVVGHEYAHAVTSETSNLYYYMQSGALNEAFSDILGEVIDQKNGRGTDGSAVRWLVGEDLNNPNVPMPLRSMVEPHTSSPPQPESMSDTARFACEPGWAASYDHGGVHANNSVVSRAFVFMVDGGSDNGVTANGVGIDKAIRVVYRAFTTYLTSGSGSLDYYDSVTSACGDLIGSYSVTAVDCADIRNALDAMRLHDPWPCGVAQFESEPLCDVGKTFETLFFEDFESGTVKWTSVVDSGMDHWTDTELILGSSYSTSGKGSLFAVSVKTSAASSAQMKSQLALPSGDVRLRFNHSFGFVVDGILGPQDGAIVALTPDNGTTWYDLGASVLSGAGYNGNISGTSVNPFAGSAAFVGDSFGYTTTTIDLGSFAGRSVRLAFLMSTGFKLVNDIGWFIDDVHIYRCVADSCGSLNAPSRPSSNPAHPESGVAYTVSWPSVSGAKSYELQESTQTDFSGASSVTVSGTSKSFTHTVSSDTDYYYRVRAKNDCGSESGWSPTLALTVTAESGPSCSYTVSPTSKAFPAEGGTGQVSVTADSGCDWSASSNRSWAWISSGATGSGAGTVSYTVDANTGSSSRNATLAVAGKTVTISQSGVSCGATVPTAAMTVSPVTPRVGQSVTFTDTSGGQVDSRSWSVWRGGVVVVTGTQPTLTHSFSSADSYVAKLEVSNCAGSSTASHAFDVIETAAAGSAGLVVPLAGRKSEGDGVGWQTDVWLHNPCDEELVVDVAFLPNDSAAFASFWISFGMELTVPARGSTALVDAVGMIPAMSNRDIEGSLTVEGVEPAWCRPAVVARRQHVSPDGVYGYVVPVLEASSPRGGRISLTGLAEDEGTRTDVAVVNIGDAPVPATLSVVNADGSRVGQELSADLPGRSRIDVESVLAAVGGPSELRPFTVQIEAGGDGVTAVATIVDRHTDDPTVLVHHDDAHPTLWVPGVAHVGDGSGLTWRADLSAFNADDEDCSASVSYFREEAVGERLFLEFPRIRPLRGFHLADVVGYMLGAGDSQGYLKLSSLDGEPLPSISTRLHVEDPAGGHYGQQLPAFGSDELLAAGDVGVIPGVESSASEEAGLQTNLGVLNTSEDEDAVLRLTLYEEDGSVVFDISGWTVEPEVLRHAGLDELVGVAGTAPRGSLEVEVLSGGPVAVYASITDNQTRDSWSVPAVGVE